MFLMKHAFLHLPDNYHPTMPVKERYVLYGCEKACGVYLRDVVNLVTSGVQEELRGHLDDLDIALRSHSRDRDMALKLWRRQEHPLAYDNDAYQQLVDAVSSDRDNLRYGLPASTIGQKSVTWFAHETLDSATKSGTRIHPPFWKGGRALSVFRVVINESAKLFQTDLKPGSDFHHLMKAMICRALTTNKIYNIPWSPNPTRMAGRPSTTVVHSVWVNLGKSASLSLTTNTNARISALDGVTQQAISNDTRAEWSCGGISLRNLAEILPKTCLPREWDVGSMTWSQASNASYVKETYIWVKEHYDGTKHLHKLALVYAIIFSKCIPRVCNEVKPHDILPSADSTPIVRQCAWASPKDPNRKGMKDPIPFIIMMTTFIIALYEETSPLRTYMNSHKGSMGDPWTKKHS